MNNDNKGMAGKVKANQRLIESTKSDCDSWALLGRRF